MSEGRGPAAGRSGAHGPATLGRGLAAHLPVAVAVAVAAVIDAPVLRFGFVSDDFQWWQHAAAALRRPSLLVAPFGGFRPAFTWVMALEDLAFGTSPRGYHTVGLLLFLLCGVLLAGLLRRIGCGPWFRAAVVALWLCSPFCSEPALSVVASDYTLTLACWLGLALLWPGPGERWHTGGALAAGLLAAFSAALLEAWVVLPGFALAFELGLRDAPLRTAVRRAAWTLVPVLLYVAAYFAHPPFKVASYYSVGLGGAAKIPHIWASFLALTTLRPLDIRFGAPEVLGLVTLAAVAWLGFRRRSRFALVGFAFFLLPLLPVVPVPFVPTRYTAVPFAGFLMAVGGVGAELAKEIDGARAVAARVAAGGLVAVYFVASVFWFRNEIADGRRFDQLHRELVAEAERFAPSLPSRGTVVAARCEHDNPLLRLAAAPRGLPKIYYPRHEDPYGLIDTAALWSWVRAPLGGPMYRDAAADAPHPGPVTVVVHEAGGFVKLPAAGSVRRIAAGLQQRGCYVRFLTPW